MRPPGKPIRTDQIFAALQRAVPKAQPREARRNAWISEETWRLVNERVSTRRDPRYGQAFKRKLGKAVKKSLAEDRKRRAEEAGAEVEALMKADPPLIQEAWYHIQGWYKAAVDRAPPPARVTLKRITAERVALYSRVPPSGENIPVRIEHSRWRTRCRMKGKLSGRSNACTTIAPGGRRGCGRSTSRDGLRRHGEERR